MLRYASFALAVAIGLHSPALAQEFAANQSVDVKSVTVSEQGETEITYAPAELVAPGQTLRFRIDYTNEHDIAVDDVSLVMTIPAEVVVDLSTRFPDDMPVFYATADQAEFRDPYDSRDPLQDPDSIRQLQWSFVAPIEPGETGFVSVEAVLK